MLLMLKGGTTYYWVRCGMLLKGVTTCCRVRANKSGLHLLLGRSRPVFSE